MVTRLVRSIIRFFFAQRLRVTRLPGTGMRTRPCSRCLRHGWTSIYLVRVTGWSGDVGNWTTIRLCHPCKESL